MPDEVRALTDELQAVNKSLRDVLHRLESIEKRTKTERYRAWWHRAVTVLVVMLVAGLVVVAFEQRQQRIDNCDAMRNAFDAYTAALADFSRDGRDRDPVEAEHFDARVRVFRAEIQTRLADCT